MDIPKRIIENLFQECPAPCPVNLQDLEVVQGLAAVGDPCQPPRGCGRKSRVPYFQGNPETSRDQLGDLQDPKMEVLYHMFGHILWGYYLT